MDERGRWITLKNGNHVFLRPGESVKQHFNGNPIKLQKTVPEQYHHTNDELYASRHKDNTDHIERRKKKKERNISDRTIDSVIKNPLHKSDVRIDDKGRPSVTYIGEKITVIINPDTNARITVRKTTKYEKKKYKKNSRVFGSTETVSDPE